MSGKRRADALDCGEQSARRHLPPGHFGLSVCGCCRILTTRHVLGRGFER